MRSIALSQGGYNSLAVELDGPRRAWRDAFGLARAPPSGRIAYYAFGRFTDKPLNAEATLNQRVPGSSPVEN